MKPSTRWPLGITALLALFVGVNVYLMRVANDDPSFSVEPDYYHKAVVFDSTIAQERRNVVLGWRASTSIDPDAGAG